MAPDAKEQAEKATLEHWRARATRMRDLLDRPEWEFYCQELEELEKEAIERMVAGSDEHHALRGHIHGLRAAVHRPAIIIDYVRRLATHE